jgi:hypothetical protein
MVKLTQILSANKNKKKQKVKKLKDKKDATIQSVE